MPVWGVQPLKRWVSALARLLRSCPTMPDQGQKQDRKNPMMQLLHAFKVSPRMLRRFSSTPLKSQSDSAWKLKNRQVTAFAAGSRSCGSCMRCNARPSSLYLASASFLFNDYFGNKRTHTFFCQLPVRCKVHNDHRRATLELQAGDQLFQNLGCSFHALLLDLSRRFWARSIAMGPWL